MPERKPWYPHMSPASSHHQLKGPSAAPHHLGQEGGAREGRGDWTECSSDPASVKRSLAAESKENFFPREAGWVMLTAQLITQDPVGS